MAAVRADSNGDAANRGGDWRGATIMASDGYGEEVGQHWIQRLAAAVVEMQGKEGTTESKERKGYSGSGSKEATIGKKGEDERWQRRLRQRRSCGCYRGGGEEMTATGGSEGGGRVAAVVGEDFGSIGSRKQRWCRYASVPKKELPAVASAEALVRVSWVGLRLMSLSVEKSGWRQ
ncbi:hypothetical protein GW17_00037443 [Ensete ventricosum]|nr:hypothetical protein GW17_00037443 [Ensete ventricosum]